MDNLVDDVESLLNTIQHDMLETARSKLQIVKVESTLSLHSEINMGKLALAQHCDVKECELSVVGDGIKSLCKPLHQESINGKCFNCDNGASTWTLFGKSY